MGAPFVRQFNQAAAGALNTDVILTDDKTTKIFFVMRGILMKLAIRSLHAIFTSMLLVTCNQVFLGTSN